MSQTGLSAQLLRKLASRLTFGRLGSLKSSPSLYKSHRLSVGQCLAKLACVGVGLEVLS